MALNRGALLDCCLHIKVVSITLLGKVIHTNFVNYKCKYSSKNFLKTKMCQNAQCVNIKCYH